MSIFYDVAQGTDRWSHLRMGRPTASDFDQVLTPSGEVSEGKKKGTVAQKTDNYENKLIAEIMLMRPIRTMAPTYAMERGTNLEGEAREAFEFATGEKLTHGGFFTDDLGYCGASPDGLVVGKNEGAEIKCPLSEEKHIGYLINPQSFVDEHACQVQGQIFVCGFERVHMISYYPELPRVIVPVEPIKVFQDSLAVAIPAMRERMGAKLIKLAEAGHINLEGFTAKQAQAQQKSLMETL